jgi:hypothetical protein
MPRSQFDLKRLYIAEPAAVILDDGCGPPLVVGLRFAHLCRQIQTAKLPVGTRLGVPGQVNKVGDDFQRVRERAAFFAALCVNSHNEIHPRKLRLASLSLRMRDKCIAPVPSVTSASGPGRPGMAVLGLLFRRH